jgi:hypothetical protein
LCACEGVEARAPMATPRRSMRKAGGAVMMQRKAGGWIGHDGAGAAAASRLLYHRVARDRGGKQSVMGFLWAILMRSRRLAGVVVKFAFASVSGQTLHAATSRRCP